MSQNMHFEEEPRGYQGIYTPTLGEPTEGYERHAPEIPAQKLSKHSTSSSGASASQRLALAIVSMFVLLGGLGMVGNNTENLGQMFFKLISLFIVCISAIAINAIFNRGH
jgi:glycerol uptake facilitator-like aquaporin